MKSWKCMLQIIIDFCSCVYITLKLTHNNDWLNVVLITWWHSRFLIYILHCHLYILWPHIWALFWKKIQWLCYIRSHWSHLGRIHTRARARVWKLDLWVWRSFCQPLLIVNKFLKNHANLNHNWYSFCQIWREVWSLIYIKVMHKSV